MNPKLLAAGLLVVGCLGAAAGGAYYATRQNAAQQPGSAVSTPGPQPVSETEAVLGKPGGGEPAAAEADPPSAPAAEAPEKAPAVPAARPEPRRSRPVTQPRPTRAAAPEPEAPPQARVERPQERVPVAATPIEPPPNVLPPVPPEVQWEELVIPASSVIGLQVETPLSSERSRVEDRVDARVTRDVTAAGRVAIPAGSRVIGAVSMVEPGGKMKGTARLGVRFHTLVLGDGRQVPLRTEAVYREGDSAGNESARKIGGAAIGGAILGAILGGGKGAAIGGAAGAGAGSAAVMAGDRNAATLPAGTIVNVRLAAPATIDVEKR